MTRKTARNKARGGCMFDLQVREGRHQGENATFFFSIDGEAMQTDNRSFPSHTSSTCIGIELERHIPQNTTN